MEENIEIEAGNGNGGNVNEIEIVAANTGNVAAAEDNGTPLLATGNPPNNTKRAILAKFWMVMVYASMFLMLFSLKHTLL